MTSKLSLFTKVQSLLLQTFRTQRKFIPVLKHCHWSWSIWLTTTNSMLELQSFLQTLVIPLLSFHLPHLKQPITQATPALRLLWPTLTAQLTRTLNLQALLRVDSLAKCWSLFLQHLLVSFLSELDWSATGSTERTCWDSSRFTKMVKLSLMN